MKNKINKIVEWEEPICDTFFGRIFGHRWRCYMMIGSRCERCGVVYGEKLKTGEKK